MSNEDFPALPGAPASDPKIVFDNFSDPSGGSGSILDSVKMNSIQLTPEQELAKSHQSRKGIQTSPDGELINIGFNFLIFLGEKCQNQIPRLQNNFKTDIYSLIFGW